MDDLRQGRSPRRGVALISKVLIVGAGWYGRSVTEAVLAGGEHSVVGFVDDTFSRLEFMRGIPVFGKVVNFKRWRGVADCAIVTISNNVVRQQITDGMPGAVGSVNCATVVGFHCRVGAYGHLGGNVAMAGGSSLDGGAWMQAGFALGYCVEISEGRVLAAGEAMSR